VAALKGDVLGRLGLGPVGAIAEQTELPRYDFSPVAFAASVLGFVLAGIKPSFDVYLTAFAQEPVAGIGQLSERDDPMPICTLLLRAVAVRKTLGRGEREIRHVLP
jgi:hypothetical protein